MSAKNSSSTHIERELIRIGKYLNETISVTDNAGKVLYQTVKPLMVEFYIRDVLQLFVGATLLAVPLAYTEEVWKLGTELPWLNIAAIVLVSNFFVGSFVFYNFYRGHIKANWLSFIQRVFSTYIISLAVSLLMLFLVNKIEYDMFWDITIKRMILISFPASMSASIADVIK